MKSIKVKMQASKQNICVVIFLVQSIENCLKTFLNLEAC